MHLYQARSGRCRQSALAALIVAATLPALGSATPPVLQPVPSIETQPYANLGYFLLLASDPDGDALSFLRPAPEDLPVGATLVDLGILPTDAGPTHVSLLAWMPMPSQVGEYAIPVEVSDGSASVSATAMVRVRAPVPPPRDRDGDGVVTVACIGDSNSASIPALGPSWCDVLDVLLDGATDAATTEHTWDTEARGVSGTIAGTFPVDRAIAEGPPDVMIFAFGTNDLRGPHTPAELVDVYGAMMRRAWQAGVTAFVATTPDYYRETGPPADCSPGNPAGVAELNARVVATFGQAVIDFHDGITCPADVLDWLHFTPSGYAKRARAAFDVLVPEPRFARCKGQRATIVGTSGPDRIVGTKGDDVIVGLGGNDRVAARGGNDVVCGGAGSDHLRGDTGDDVLVGGADDDVLLGAGGNDTLFGDAGWNLVRGAKGVDVCVPGDPGSVADRACETVLPPE